MENKMKEQIIFEQTSQTSNVINLSKNKKSTLRDALMDLLNTNQYSTQQELATALKNQGFGEISQAKMSRLLTNARAIKKYDKDKSFYQCPNEKQRLQSIDSVGSLALNIAHNKTHIVLKTVKGGAAIVETMLGTMSKSHGILGCIASDTTILIIPCDTSKINDLVHSVKSHLKMDTLHVVSS